MKLIINSVPLSKVKSLTLSESQEQTLLFKWAGWNHTTYPELEMMYAVPNGGKRDIVTATHLKAEGVKAGVPDICLPVPRGGYHGLYIELKVHGNKPSELQESWLRRLSEQGYFTAVCYGWYEAAETIKRYLGATIANLNEVEIESE